MHKSVRIVLSFTFVIVLMTITGLFGRGVQAADGMYKQGTAMWSGQNGAARYNVYYKESGMTSWQHSVRDLASNASSITIGYLKPGVTYWYRVSAEDQAGKEFWWSAEMKLNAMTSTTPMPMNQTMPSQPQTIAPTTIYTGSWTSATIHWVPNGNAQYYNIYYKEAGQSSYMYSVPQVPNNASTLTINGLKSTAKYYYNVAAYYGGKEYWMGEKVLSWGPPPIQAVTLSNSMMLPDPTTMVPPVIMQPTTPVMMNDTQTGVGGTNPQQMPQDTPQQPIVTVQPTMPQGNEPVYQY